MVIKQSHILIIDDNEDILSMLQAMLQFKEYRVSVKNILDDIESVIGDLRPDVILMDMFLCGVDGRDICKQLKTNIAFSYIPVIMISAHPLAKGDCLEAGADYFLEKPFEMKDICQAIAEVTKKPAGFLKIYDRD